MNCIVELQCGISVIVHIKIKKVKNIFNFVSHWFSDPKQYEIKGIYNFQ